MKEMIEYLKKRPQLITTCVMLTGLAILLWSLSVDTAHGHSWLERHIPGFWSLFGIISCIVLIFVARWFSSTGIEREEDYYDD
ncbi:MAG: hypothetical protein CR981_02570 [Proteobacteria bacterium]|nr:MAG: hypothetical protein CR981_02570 [Pseudomonadota bacterium]PIE64448.1 MAG: hypothetical protein CSA26_08220 [Desulfobacterales bacterium]